MADFEFEISDVQLGVVSSFEFRISNFNFPFSRLLLALFALGVFLQGSAPVLGLPPLDLSATDAAGPTTTAIATGSRGLPVAETLAFNGRRAFDDLKRLVAFGPRPPGSKALADSRAWIIRELKSAGCEVDEDAFVASTPVGTIPMTNVIARILGARSSVVMVAGHYETMRFDDGTFVGANDGASSAAFLLELARLLGRRKNPVTYWLVFFDGEEALREWSAKDSLYGSRHLVQKLARDGQLNRVQAMILVDMIADANLDIHREYNSTPWLTDMVFDTARRLGYAKYFLNGAGAIQDDHLPWVNAGVSAVDIIDLDFGPNNSYHHTPQDTVDKCSPQSMTIVGRVVTAVLQELEKSPRVR